MEASIFQSAPCPSLHLRRRRSEEERGGEKELKGLDLWCAMPFINSSPFNFRSFSKSPNNFCVSTSVLVRRRQYSLESKWGKDLDRLKGAETYTSRDSSMKVSTALTASRASSRETCGLSLWIHCALDSILLSVFISRVT